MPRCRHCRSAAADRPGRLCAPCHQNAALRQATPPPPGPLAEGDPADLLFEYKGPPPLPAFPTRLPPGRARVEVLAARAARGEELWHPGDQAGPEKERPGRPRTGSVADVRREGAA